MPVHDWTRVSAGTFHDFHSAWIVHLKETLNAGLLPEGFYALAEQHAGQLVADVLTLHTGEQGHLEANGNSGGKGASGNPVAVAQVPPRVRRKVVPGPQAAYRRSRRSLAIRHTSNHRLVALIEIVSPANKDRASSVQEFVRKCHSALQSGCHLLVVDLFPPSPWDAKGIHEAIFERFDPESEDKIPSDKPLTLAAYLAQRLPVAYHEPIAVGDRLPDMPLFLDPDWYINTPLETTYLAAYRGVPAVWREVLEGSGE